MPNRLHRYYGAGYSHFITTSCYQRLPLLRSAGKRDLFTRVLRRYRFVVGGYVAMPKHVHRLISEQSGGIRACQGSLPYPSAVIGVGIPHFVRNDKT